MKRFIGAILILFFLISGCYQGQPQNVKLVTLAGQVIDMANLKGRPVFLNYWASWCEPCRQEIPELNRFAKTHPNIWVLGVNYDGVDEQQLTALISGLGIQYPNLKTNPADALGLGDLPGVPVTFIFDSQGKLKKTLYGPQTMAQLEGALN